jgi:glycosyltransferase involved in cell wall biosynthesis
MKLSIVVPALNERHCLRQALTSALELDGEPEVLVVDGESTDGNQ